ncbi:MAG: ATP-binding protein [Bacteroidales bacterium]|nr:ATP-binding protein [Bacteroidales bacterium]
MKEGFSFPESDRLFANCEFCGAEREMIGIIHPLKPKTVLRWEYYTSCTCEGYQNYLAEREKEFEKEQEENRRKAMLEEERRRKEIFANQIKKLLGESGIRRRFLNRTFNRFKVTKQNEQAYLVSKHYANTFADRKEQGEGLYFVGGNGVGKTHLAAAIALELINMGTPVIFKTAIELLEEIKKTFDSDEGATEYEILQAYKNVDLLVIDDLGKESPTDWALATLYNIINDRYENMLPIIVTTNYSDVRLIRRLSKNGDPETAKAIVSRLHEMCLGVEMAGVDYRSMGGSAG